MKQTSLIPLAFCLLAVTLTNAILAGEKLEPIFDGKTLNGWTQKGGKAKYKVEDGMVVGTAVIGTPNSFLCTEKVYGNFILELEFKVDTRLNSGVQIRSQAYDKDTTVETRDKNGNVKMRKFQAGRVHGYQVEIDPSERSWSGGIYDESRRGWLHNLAGEKYKVAREAYKSDDWNHYRIVCKGDSIKTWINGVPATDLKDDMTAKGFIGLQVHSIRSPEQVGLKARWRNIRLQELE